MECKETMSWYDGAKKAEEDCEVDWESECILCPICEEPVYQCDFPKLPSEDGYPFCPICGSFFN